MQLELEGFEILSDEECRQMLAGTALGRVAVSFDALPVVLPVNYRMLDDDVVVFFTGPGTKLRRAVDRAVVAFEIDGFDDQAETGWSVMAIGATFEIFDPVTIEAVRVAGLRPWAEGERSHLIGIRTEFLSGRRIATGASRPDRS